MPIHPQCDKKEHIMLICHLLISLTGPDHLASLLGLSHSTGTFQSLSCIIYRWLSIWRPLWSLLSTFSFFFSFFIRIFKANVSAKWLQSASTQLLHFYAANLSVIIHHVLVGGDLCPITSSNNQSWMHPHNDAGLSQVRCTIMHEYFKQLSPLLGHQLSLKSLMRILWLT